MVVVVVDDDDDDDDNDDDDDVPPAPPPAAIHPDSGRCPGQPPRTGRAAGGRTSWPGLGLTRTRTRQDRSLYRSSY